MDAQVHAWDRGGRPADRPDVVHDHGIWLPTNHRSASLAHRLHVPRMVSVHGMLEPWALGNSRFRKRLVWWLYQRRDLARALVHVTSEAAQQVLYPLDEAEVLVQVVLPPEEDPLLVRRHVAAKMLLNAHSIEVATPAADSSEFRFRVTPTGQRVRSDHFDQLDEFIIELLERTADTAGTGQ